MNVYLQGPRQRKQDKDPEIVCTQPAAYGFPFADREAWADQISRYMLGPFLVRGNGAMRKHRCKITGLEHPYTVCPNLVIPITTRLHKKEYGYENSVYRNSKMRIVRRTKNK